MNYPWVENEHARRRANYERLVKAARQRRIELGIDLEQIPITPKEVERDVLLVASSYVREEDERPQVKLPAGYLPDWKRITIEECNAAGVTFEHVVGDARNYRVVQLRQKIWWRLCRETQLSTTAIARRFNKRDHTTVIHGIRQHEKRMAEGEAA